ncbi:hypothetical protein L6R52_24895 [Myxococcota bacterium]|nr:hypothetical protein [Myxococcota bacterium]
MSSHFERALLAELKKSEGAERFELEASSVSRLVRALERDLDGSDPLGAVQAGLRYAAAFDGKLASPSVAVAIRELLRRDVRAVALIRRSRAQTSSAVSETRRFLRAEGRTAAVRAPSFGAPPPRAAIPLRALIDPGKTKPAPGSAAKRSLRG